MKPRAAGGRRALASALLALVLAGCARVGSSATGGRHWWTDPTTLRIASANLPRTLDPLLATQTVEVAILRLTNDLLVTVDTRGRFVPDLAREVPTTANGGISRDGLTITYHLRRNVRWHDGVPFTSRDVRFTFDAVMNPNNDVISHHGYDVVARVETPDPYTVVFRLKHRFAPFVATVFGESDSPYEIVPAHLLARYKTIDDVPYNGAPIGTGPYKFVRWSRGDRIEFVRNDDYFGPRPKIARIVWRLVPDENTEITLLRTHEIDWMFEASVSAYKTIKVMPETSVSLNQTNGFEGLLLNSQRARPTGNPDLRRAIAMALDKPRLATTLTFGAGLVATGDLPPFLWAFDPALRNLAYDPAASRAILARLGYTPARPLTLDLVYEESQVVTRSLAVQIQQALAAVGITVIPRAQLSSVIYAGYSAGGTLQRGTYDLAIEQWYSGIDPDDSAQFTCANIPPGGYNQVYYCSRAMDVAQARALRSYEIAQRKLAYARIESLLVRDVPVDFLWWPRNVQAFNPDLRGFDPNPVTETWDIARWSL